MTIVMTLLLIFQSQGTPTFQHQQSQLLVVFCSISLTLIRLSLEMTLVNYFIAPKTLNLSSLKLSYLENPTLLLVLSIDIQVCP